MSKSIEFSMECANGGRGSHGTVGPLDGGFRFYVCLDGQYADTIMPRASLIEMRAAIDKALEENPDVG